MVYDIVIIGGGASGMMCAISAAQTSPGTKIVLLEKNDRLGRKLAITGHGRCNITNSAPLRETLNKYGKGESKFLKHSFYNLKNEDLLNIFREKGLEFKVEGNNRVFPITEKSQSVINVLKSYLSDLNVEIKLNFDVESVEKDSDLFLIKSKDNVIKSRSLVLATGGLTYPNTGSTGDGYRFASNLSHHISAIKPAACGFIINDNNLIKLKGLSFENLKVSFRDMSGKNIERCGDMLISHNGLTGPVIINLSNELMNNQDFDMLNGIKDFKKTDIFIDFAPDSNREELKNGIINTQDNKKEIHNYLNNYLPNNFSKYFLDTIGVDRTVTLSNLSKKDRNKIIEGLKSFKLTVDNIAIKSAYITLGGIELDEINPKTLESKLVDGLYFAGEILDVCGPTGGYNLMIAFTTAYLAGQSVARSVNS